MIKFVYIFILFFSFNLQAATITLFTGDVKLLDKNTQRFKSKLKYEGKTYSYRKARIGQKIKRGQALLTSNGAKARIVYNDGSQVNVGPASFITINPKKKTKQKDVKSIDMVYGKLRAIISSKKNKRKTKFIIKGQSAIAGVRGTDFFFKQSLNADAAQVTVLSGEVSYKEKVEAKKEVSVTKGETIFSGKSIAKKPVKSTTTKRNLVHILGTTKINKVIPEKEKPKEILKLEKKAEKVVVQEIKEYAPELLKVAKNNIEEQYIKHIIKKSPNPPEASDPYVKYQKYFSE